MLFKEEEVQKLENRCHSIIEKRHTVTSNVIKIQLSDSALEMIKMISLMDMAWVQLYLTKKSSWNKLVCISKAFVFLLRVYTSIIVSWPDINFVLCHKYDTCATEVLVVAFNELVSSLLFWNTFPEIFRLLIHNASWNNVMVLILS